MCTAVVLFICLGVAVPLVALAWAMRRTECPNCGAPIDPDSRLGDLLHGE